MLNIFDQAQFSTEKANVISIKKDDKIQCFAVALGENAVMKKHKTAVPALLVVLKGEINFVFSDRSFPLKEFDTFEIPVDEEHEVIGLGKENLFLITKEF